MLTVKISGLRGSVKRISQKDLMEAPCCEKKRGDAAWDDRVALCPVTVLTTVTENREQEVMLSSPVSLAPSRVEQSGCQGRLG